MTRGQRVLGAIVTAAVLSAAGSAYGDPVPGVPPAMNYLHIVVPWHLTTDSGTKLDLPPGYFEDEPTHDKVDAEYRRLQDAETRLRAENDSMRKTLSGWEPGWYTLLIATTSALALGWYVHDKL